MLEDTALVLYGTLRPGEVNHWLVNRLGGQWFKGTISGWQFDISWGAAEGYPGVILDPDGPDCEVVVLVSEKLPKHWHEIDQFEGEGYRRVPVEVHLTSRMIEQQATTGNDATETDVIAPGATIVASVYETLQDNPD